MGHPVVAFSQEQLCEVLHQTSNESCRHFYWMMKDLLLKAGQLRKEKTSRRRGPSSVSGKRGKRQVPIPSSTDSESQVCSDTRGVMDTDDAAEAGLCVETESAISARVGPSGHTGRRVKVAIRLYFR